MLSRIRVPAGSLLVLALAACSPQKPETATAANARPVPVASIQELMQSLVDPTADALWESVSSTVSREGVEDKQPRTPEDWLALRHLALRLAEAGNLLAQEGRPVAHEGHQLEDAHVKGILDSAQIEQRIKDDPAAFRRQARQLQDAAVLTLQAIDRRDLDKFLEAGGRIDQACEACHMRYWYPNERRP